MLTGLFADQNLYSVARLSSRTLLPLERILEVTKTDFGQCTSHTIGGAKVDPNRGREQRMMFSSERNKAKTGIANVIDDYRLQNCDGMGKGY